MNDQGEIEIGPEPQCLILNFDDQDLEPNEAEQIRHDLSACALAGGSLWLGTDETITLERLTPVQNGWGNHERIHLSDHFSLPEGRHAECDIEGLAFDGGFLWMVGSHSRGRQKPKSTREERGDPPTAMPKAKKAPNRQLLGRLRLVPETLAEPEAAGKGKSRGKSSKLGRAAAVRIRKGRSDLLRLIEDDPHLARFLKIPAKENGFDIEGLAVTGERVFLGLRGPVLRGWATVLELKLEETEPGRLELMTVPGSGARLRKHFLELDGLGIRDLKLDGQDMLVLAGPTMSLDGPVRLYRWPNALHESPDPGFVTRETFKDVLDLPFGVNCDHAEAVQILDGASGSARRLLVVYDEPAEWRVPQHGRGYWADVIRLVSA